MVGLPKLGRVLIYCQVRLTDNSQMSELETLFEQSFLKDSVSQFVRKVYLLLESHRYDEILGWDTDGRTIVIRDCQKIGLEVLPVVFKQKTLKSFVRQLNMYNFKKVKKDQEPETERLYFRNEHFSRGDIESLIFIKRKQRGYVEPARLENLETVSIYERYKTYSNGVVTKLKAHFGKLQEKYPEVSAELLAGLNRQSAQQMHYYMPWSVNDLEAIPRLTMLESFRSFYNVPVFASAFSLFAEDN